MHKFHKDYLARSIDLINLESLGTKINIIGCGATGSALAVILAKMGFGNMTVWDFDTVEAVNIGCQRHNVSDIGTNKALASKHAVNEASGFNIEAKDVAYTGERLQGIVISCVDVMSVRRQIWENTAAGSFLVDPRMAATDFDLITCLVGSSDDKLYEPTLFSDEQAVRVPCTMKSTMFCADLLAGFAAHEVFKFTTDKKVTKRLLWNGEANSLTDLYNISIVV